MKKLVAMTCALLCAILCAMSYAAKQSLAAEAPKKPLIAYFSMSGHTKTIAGDIQALTGGELLEIIPAKDYPSEYHKLTEEAKAEQEKNARPPVKTKIANPDQYDVIFLGFPNWWSSMPMPVYTFIEENGLNGKTIIPFSTHGGGGLGHCIEDLKKLCPNSKILKAFSVSGPHAVDAMPAVKSWLEGLKLPLKASN